MSEAETSFKTNISDFYSHKVEELQQVSSELSRSFNTALAEGSDDDLEVIKANLKDEPNLGILVDLARQGDIDPWDLDLEKVTTAYLKAISINRGETLREAGQAIFYASVLLRMKSDILIAESKDALSIGLHRELDDDAMLEDELASHPTKQITFDDLEAAIRRRFIQKAKRFRKLTLKDLISALQDAKDEEDMRQARKQQKLFDLDAYHIIAPELSGDIMDLTHAEDLEHCISRLQVILPEHLLDGEGMEFQKLVTLLGSWSNAFLSVIFLAHDNQIKLTQEEFYKDLWIYEPESK